MPEMNRIRAHRGRIYRQTNGIATAREPTARKKAKGCAGASKSPALSLQVLCSTHERDLRKRDHAREHGDGASVASAPRGTAYGRLKGYPDLVVVSPHAVAFRPPLQQKTGTQSAHFRHAPTSPLRDGKKEHALPFQNPQCDPTWKQCVSMSSLCLSWVFTSKVDFVVVAHSLIRIAV